MIQQALDGRPDPVGCRWSIQPEECERLSELDRNLLWALWRQDK
jgi:hypothetical protein